jgi:hypothetical protein
MIGGPNSDAHEQPVPMNRHAKDQPLIPAFSPYEGEKENLSLVLEHANGLDPLSAASFNRRGRGWHPSGMRLHNEIDPGGRPLLPFDDHRLPSANPAGCVRTPQAGHANFRNGLS